ncbi:MAG: hypothetical protein ABI721_01405 [Candidatus Dojkabacteria bacterium]
MSTSIFLFIAGLMVFLGVLIGGVSFLTGRLKDSHPRKISVGRILQVYYYGICLLSIVFIATGLISILRATMSYIGGYQFSYQVNNYYQPTPVDSKPIAPDATYLGDNQSLITINSNQYIVNTTAQREELVIGVSLLVSSLIIFALHILLNILFIKRISGPVSPYSLIAKTYNFTLLAIFSLSSLILIPTSIYQIVNYILDNGKVITYTSPVPGEYLSGAIIVSIFWLYYLVKCIAYYSKESK